MSPISVVIDRATIQQRVTDLAHEIDDRYREREPVMLGVLTGAVPFLADLTRHMTPELEIDFLSLTRFGRDGRVSIAVDSATSIAGRHVIVVEDIVDTGMTLKYLLGLLETREPASIETVALIDKTTRRIVDVPLAYRGFEVGDEFLLGYGLDWEERYRNLPDIWAVMDLGEFRDDPEVLARRFFQSPGDSVQE